MTGPEGPALLLANPDSLFPRQLAACWRSRGIETVIATYDWNGPDALPDGTRILSASAVAGERIRMRRRWKIRALERLWKADVALFRGRYRRAMGADASTFPSFVSPLSAADTAAEAVRRIAPRFVFGMEAYFFGPATAACRDVPRILMPWGGDIFLSAEASPVNRRMVRNALRGVDLVCPTSTAAAARLRDRFGVPPARIATVSWGVDRSLFRRADPARRDAILARYRIAPGARVVLNARRFLPVWGSEEVLAAFLALASREPGVHLVLLGGAGSEAGIAAALRRVDALGLSGRFTAFPGDLPLAEVADLMAVADVYLSLMRVQDMRSFSVLQGAAAGGVPVLADQPEYRAMEGEGFSARFVDPARTEDVVSTVLRLVRNEAECAEIRKGNDLYLARGEDRETQMDRLLDAIGDACRRFRDRGAASAG